MIHERISIAKARSYYSVKDLGKKTFLYGSEKLTTNHGS